MGRSGEACLFLLPSEMEFVGALEATGTVMHQVDLLPILGDLPVALQQPQVCSVAQCWFFLADFILQLCCCVHVKSDVMLSCIEHSGSMCRREDKFCP